MTVGSLNSTQRPPDRANIALFYAASSPTQVFNQAAEQVAMQQGRSLSQNAHTLALINMAMNDSLVASFLNKYHYNFWRPETAIHAGDTDGNPHTVGDPNWTPFIVTTCFPSYPSNHGSAGNAAAAILRWVYGEQGHSITLTNPAVPEIVLEYNSFNPITERHLRRARLRWDTLSNRSDSRRALGKGDRQGRVQEQLTSHAR
jgi:hypothetical protein